MPIWLPALLLSVAEPLWLGPTPTTVHRVVSLAPSTTEILCAIDACDLLVGVTRYDESPEPVVRLPKVGGFNDPDPEAVLALAPDLVLAVPTSGGRARVDALARLGLSVLVVPAETLDDLWVAVDAVGTAVGRPAKGHELAQRLQTELAALGERHRQDRRLRVLLLVGRRPLVAAGRGTFIDSLLLNADNVVTRGGGFPVLDLEALVGLDPDVIIDAAFGESPEFMEFWSRARGVGAVSRGRVVELVDNAILRPGPRLAAGLEALGHALRPEAR